MTPPGCGLCFEPNKNSSSEDAQSQTDKVLPFITSSEVSRDRELLEVLELFFFCDGHDCSNHQKSSVESELDDQNFNPKGRS